VQRIVLKAPKTEAGKRTLEVPAALAEALRAHVLRQQAYWDALGMPWPEKVAPDGTAHRPLFHSPEGEYLHPDNLSKEFTRQCRKAGIPEATMHTMRHSFVTRLLSRKDVTLKAVAAAAGHGDVRVTQLVYWHLTEDAKDEVSAAIHEEAGKLVGA
jgi:integrase